MARMLGVCLGLIVAVAMLCALPAISQTKPAELPQRALLNLYQVAQEMLADPSKDYEASENPDFPYPSDIQAQWANSIAFYGAGLPDDESSKMGTCASHLNNAITDKELGYRLEVKLKDPKQTIAPDDRKKLQADIQNDYTEAQTEFALCDASTLGLAAQEIPPPTPNKPQQADATNTAVAGSASEAALPGSIDWTPALNPLQTYLATEWNRVVHDPVNRDWAPDSEGNTLTLKLQPNQLPEVLSETGSRKNVFNSIMQNGKLPTTIFPPGSTLTNVVIAPKFLVKPSPNTGTRTRLKYYERDGVFKSYLAQQ